MRADALRSEHGEINLPGLLVATVIFGFVLMATYTAFDVFTRNTRDSQVRNEATDRARSTTDQMARQLRNLATPTALQPNAVALAADNDLIFETVSPTGAATSVNPQNIMFVRYCYSGSTRKVYAMEMPPSTITASTVAPSTAGACPGTGWSNTKVVAHDIVNQDMGVAVFTYDTTQKDNIRRVRADLYVDPDPGKGPAAQRVTTGVGLRNQDRAPTARFTHATPGGGILVLDGTSSTDPDNDPLSFCWYDSAAPSSKVGDCGLGSVGASAVLRYKPANPSIAHTITLKVTDPSGLPNLSPTRTFNSIP